MKTVAERFNAKVLRAPNGCWEWTGYVEPQGYGRFYAMGEQLAHRVSCHLHGISLAKDQCVIHSCDNRSCVNPDHLSAGTWDENNKDRKIKGRNGLHFNAGKTHCKRGHLFDEENTYTRKNGGRTCRTCERARLSQ